MEPQGILCGIVATILTLYYYFTQTFGFWKSRGVRGPQPTVLFGNSRDLMLARKATSDYVTEIYQKYEDEPMIGLFAGRTPILMVKDLDFIKDILIKDFSSFADRGIPVYEKAEPLSQHLIALEPKRWRPLRTKLSPVLFSAVSTFSAPERLDVATEVQPEIKFHDSSPTSDISSRFSAVSTFLRLDVFEDASFLQRPYLFADCRELTAKYTTDVIGSCAFGIDTNSLSDVDSEFRRMGREVFAPKWYGLLRNRIKQVAPWLYGTIGHILPQTKVTKFFTRILMENIDYREKNNIVRHDFVDTLRELKRHPDKIDIELTDSAIASQAYIFFLAGFETSSTTMSNALYELAQNHKVQDRLREEIEEAYGRDGGTLTYDNVSRMDYLDKVFKETLRKYPPPTHLVRKSMRNYTFNGTEICIPKGQIVWIPVYAIQRDPDIYPNPELFDPERFEEEAARDRDAMSYLPFGDGPRNCIGARFAIYQTKIGLARILRKYRVDTCDKTQIPYANDPKAILLAPMGGIYLRITKMQ